MLLRSVLIACFSLTLIACGGGSNSNSGDTTLTTGTLVVPETAATSSARAIAARDSNLAARLAAMLACPNVPAGYSPLQNVTVDFVDATDNTLVSAVTNSCGEFSADLPDEVVQAKAVSAGNQDVVADIDVFKGVSNGVVSTIPSAASYQIASIQSVSDSEIAFAVTDTVTNKAVIGIPDSAFEITVNSAPATINNLQSSASTSDPATVTLVLDASGSMSLSAEDSSGNTIKDSNGVNFTRTRLTAIAGHTFLDNVAAGDETGVVIFGSSVSFIDDAVLADIDLLDASNNPTTAYSFSTNGFTSVPAQLRFVIDAYNDDSKLFGSTNLDDKHPDTPDVTIDGFVPWGGLTALYDAISTGIEKTDSRSNTRKIVIAMSDGNNNSSSKTIDNVISEANTANIPVYTISYEAGDTVAMKKIADETNATTFVVDGADLSGAFQSIQTGITFQYVAGLASNTQLGDIITLKLTNGTITVERSLTR